MFSDVDQEQEIIPEELRGIPLNSMPMELYRDLEDELDHPEWYGHQPNDLASQQRTTTRLILLEDFHRNHRELMLNDNHSPYYAMVTAAALMEMRIEGNEQPYQDWEKEESLAFLDVLLGAYHEVYYPGQELPRYY